MTEPESNPPSHENNRTSFIDKFRELLPDVEFEESPEMLEARTAVLEALAEHSQDSELLRSVWAEYAKISEQVVDRKTPSNADPQVRAKLQIAALIHKALIFREIGDVQRYGQE